MMKGEKHIFVFAGNRQQFDDFLREGNKWADLTKHYIHVDREEKILGWVWEVYKTAEVKIVGTFWETPNERVVWLKDLEYRIKCARAKKYDDTP